MVATAMPPAIASTTTVPADSAAIQATGRRQPSARERVSGEAVMAGREQEQAAMVPDPGDARVKALPSGLHTGFTQGWFGAAGLRTAFPLPSRSLGTVAAVQVRTRRRRKNTMDAPLYRPGRRLWLL